MTVVEILKSNLVGTSVEIFKNSYDNSPNPINWAFSFTEHWLDPKHYGKWEKVTVLVTGIESYNASFNTSYKHQYEHYITFEGGKCLIPSL